MALASLLLFRALERILLFSLWLPNHGTERESPQLGLAGQLEPGYCAVTFVIIVVILFYVYDFVLPTVCLLSSEVKRGVRSSGTRVSPHVGAGN